MGKKKSEVVAVEEDEQTNNMNESNVAATDEGLTYEDKVAFTLPIAHPMAPRKLAKKCFKVVKKGLFKQGVSS